MSAAITTQVPTTTPDATTKAGARAWAALVVLMIPVLMISMDNTVLTFALPAISKDLAPSGTALLWVVDIYALMLAGLLVAMGSLGDRLGRRRLLLIGAVGFGAVSVIAGLSPNAEALIAARALLGIFGATLMPSTLSLLRNIFTDRRQRRTAVAVWAAGFSGGAAFGPILGGWILEHASWPAVFWINVPLVVLLVPLSLWLLPESRDPEPGPVDPVSIALSMGAMLPLVLAIKEVAGHGLTATAGYAVGIGVACAVAFVRRQRRRVHPLLDVRMFENRVFSGAILANLLSLMALAGFLYFSSQFLQLVVGLSPMSAAMVLVPGLVATIAAGFLAVWLVRYVPVHQLVSASFALSASGYAIAAFVGSVPSTATVMVAFVVLGTGIGLAETLTNDLILTSVPAHKAGAASAISETAYEVGAVLGVAVLGGLLTATYRSAVDLPPALHAPADRNAAAETLGNAMQLADNVVGPSRDELVESARLAFDLAVQRTSAAAILVALAAGAVSYLMLRDA